MRITIVPLLASLGLAFAGTAEATVTLLEDDREVRTLGEINTVSTPDVPFQDWMVGVMGRSQTSSVGTARMEGTGTGTTFSDVEFSALATTFDVSFAVDTATDVSLSGELTFDDEAFASISFVAELTGDGGVLYSVPSDPFSWDEQLDFGARQPLDYHDTLPPGSYQLVVAVQPSGGNGSGTFDFGFDLVPLPEPGTGLLVAAGLGVVLTARRSERRAT